jgi:hypothetical protein
LPQPCSYALKYNPSDFATTCLEGVLRSRDDDKNISSSRSRRQPPVTLVCHVRMKGWLMHHTLGWWRCNSVERTFRLKTEDNHPHFPSRYSMIYVHTCIRTNLFFNACEYVCMYLALFCTGYAFIKLSVTVTRSHFLPSDLLPMSCQDMFKYLRCLECTAYLVQVDSAHNALCTGTPISQHLN